MKESWEVREGDCLELLRELDDNSVDSIVTDPPYGIAFKGHKWDYEIPKVEVWEQCLRVLKPGGHMLAFSSPRTQHRMAVNIEDAGFTIRDLLAWTYAAFPKRHDIQKAARKKMREGKINAEDYGASPEELLERLEGWDITLKPSLEPITLARKPLEGSVVDNVLRWGTGGLNIGACRVGDESKTINKLESWSGFGEKERPDYRSVTVKGSWPTAIVHDGSEEVEGCFPRDSKGPKSRFSYHPKVRKPEKHDGCEDIEGGNSHDTVKPTEVMAYLCRLITPEGGLVMDPFCGSGSTGRGAIQEGFQFLGFEINPDYAEIARARIRAVEASAESEQQED